MCAVTALRAGPGTGTDAAAADSTPVLQPGARLLLSGRPGVPGCWAAAVVDVTPLVVLPVG